MEKDYRNLTQEELLIKIKELEKEVKKLNNQIIKDDRYGLNWIDCPEAFEEESENKIPILEEVKGKAISNDDGKPTHILIEGDNFHALTCLNYTHKGKIDVIYIDPPYNTGSDGFTYKDKRFLKEYPNGQPVPKEHPLRHSYWLSFMNKRLKLAFQLLKEDGFLVASIDDNEIAQLKLLLNSLSNENTKVIAVKMSEASGLKMGSTNKAQNIPKYKEYIIYAKPNGIKDLYFDKISKTQWDSEYNIYWDNFSYENKELINGIINKHIILDSDIEKIDEILKDIEIKSVTRKLKELNIKSETEQKKWLFENSWRILRTAASSSVKKLADNKRGKTNNKLFAVISARDNILYLVRGDYKKTSKSPRVQFIFAEDNLNYHPGDFWSDIKTTGLEPEGGVEFKNGKKPLQLIERIIKSNKNKNSIILDFFAGSGTTGESVIRCNNNDNGKRQSILITNNEDYIAEDICYRRFINTFEGYLNNKGIKENLKYYKTSFVGKHSPNKVTDDDRVELSYKAGYLLALSENTLEEIKKTDYYQIFENKDNATAIYFKEDLRGFDDFVKEVESLEKPTSVYIFSWDNAQGFEYNFEHIERVQIKSIPQAILEIYKSINQ